MEQVILNGAAVGVLVTLLCTSAIAQGIRDWRRPKWTVLECPCCTTFWVALVVDPTYTYLATVCFGNIAIMLIHWSMATYQTQEDQT